MAVGKSFKPPLFQVIKYDTQKVSFTSGQYTSIVGDIKNITPPGYTPIGIVGCEGHNSAGFGFTDYIMEPSGQFRLWLKNKNTSTKEVYYTLQILFIYNFKENVLWA